MKQLEEVQEIAEKILQRDPSPVVRFRIMRDVQKVSPLDEVFVDARQGMVNSHMVLELKREQNDAGDWGRFHSADHRSNAKIKTTEAAVERGLRLGLDGADHIFEKAVCYLSCLLDGTIDFPDPPERNDRWSTGKQLFVASTLARIRPDLSVLDKTWELWATVANETFASGEYDPEAEIRAHKDLTGASVKNSYLLLNGRYQLALLGSRASKLAATIESAIVAWVWHKESGVGYLCVPLCKMPWRFTQGMLDRWLTSLELLSCFPSWRRHAKGVIDWLWKQRSRNGFWDFGPRASTSLYFPLSENWRKEQNRQNDWSTRVLALMRNYFDQCGCP